MVFNGHSFLGCLLVHLGKKIASAISTSSCLLLICMVSICKENMCKISLLKSSSILHISCLMVEVEGEELTRPTSLPCIPRVILEYILDVIID